MSRISLNVFREVEALGIAESKLAVFKERYRDAVEREQVVLLASYAAFPLAITSHLLYCLREEFVPDCPWYGVPDILLSVLCDTIGYELYEMTPEVRNALLEHLMKYKGKAAFDVLEDYLIDYIQYQLNTDTYRDERARQLGDEPHPQWTVMIFTRGRREGVETIRQRLSEISAGADWKTRFKFASLVDRYADLPILAEFRYQLIEWAKKTAIGEAIEPVIDISQFPVFGTLNFEEVTLVPVQKASDDTLQMTSFKTVGVDRRGKIVRQPEKTAYFFSETLAEDIRPLEMIAIRSGEFQMGSPEDEESRYGDESPQHWVTVPPFFISKYPITQGQWRFVAQLTPVEIELNPDPSQFRGENRPVECVSWREAVEFCKRLSAFTGRQNYRLPTEAEWEFACRGGTQTPFAYGETLTTDLANFDGNSTYGSAPKGRYRKQTTDVGNFPPNPYGLCDMHGNVWEWCQDTWHRNYEGAPTDGSAWIDKNENDSRVLRGGSWSLYPAFCRSAYRFRYVPGAQDFNFGFRVVCAVPRLL